MLLSLLEIKFKNLSGQGRQSTHGFIRIEYIAFTFISTERKRGRGQFEIVGGH